MFLFPKGVSHSVQTVVCLYSSPTTPRFDQNKDEDVHVGAWTRVEERTTVGQIVSRQLKYAHPVKSRFPGMPTHAKTFKTQQYHYNEGIELLGISEKLRFEGIPYSDFFTGMYDFGRWNESYGGIGILVRQL